MAVLQGVEKGVPLSKSAQQTLIDEGMLEGLQYDASLCMDSAPLGHMTPFVENSDLIDAFIAACNVVVYDKATAEDAAKELYTSIINSDF